MTRIFHESVDLDIFYRVGIRSFLLTKFIWVRRYLLVKINFRTMKSVRITSFVVISGGNKEVTCSNSIKYWHSCGFSYGIWVWREFSALEEESFCLGMLFKCVLTELYNSRLHFLGVNLISICNSFHSWNVLSPNDVESLSMTFVESTQA